MKDETKKWQTQSNKDKVCFYLIARGVAFHYTEKSGIVFEAAASFVERMSDALVTVYGCSLRPIIEEVK